MRDIAVLSTQPRTLDVPCELALLGPSTISWYGRPLSLTRRQARALLYRIAASSQPVSREYVCFLLWPDASTSSARRKLTVLLNHIRSMLPEPALIVATDDWLQLDQHLICSDTAMFMDAMMNGRRNRCSAALQEAVALYRGPFLQGVTLPSSVEFEQWITQERRIWETRLLVALTTMIDIHLADGNMVAAIDVAMQYLALDPLAEEVHCLLIELYAHSGNRTAAIRQFQLCASILERELEASPLPETYELYEAVRHGHVPSRSSVLLRFRMLS